MKELIEFLRKEQLSESKFYIITKMENGKPTYFGSTSMNALPKFQSSKGWANTYDSKIEAEKIAKQVGGKVELY